jgi:hypothetical protein
MGRTVNPRAAAAAPPPPPGFPPSNFKSWKTHQLQEYLLTYLPRESQLRRDLPNIHLKFKLIKFAKDCEQQVGTPAVLPKEHPQTHSRVAKRGGKKKFVTRSKEHHAAMAAAQRDLYHHNVKHGGGNSHGFMYGHPTVQNVGFAHVQSHKNVMIGSVSTDKYEKSSRTLHKAVYGEDTAHTQIDTLAEVTAPSTSAYHAPSILVARSYRNWHSPRDHKEYERRKTFQSHHRNRSLQHTNPMSESMREDFDFDRHPELDWPKYSCCESSLGRHCPEFCASRCCRFCCDPCSETGEHGGSDWAGHFGVGHDLYFKYLKLLGVTFTFMSIIMLPAMIINSYGAVETDTEGLALYRMSLGNLGDGINHNGTIKLPCNLVPGGEKYWTSCFMDRELYAWYYGVSDFFASCFFMLAIGWLWHYEGVEIVHFQQLASFASVADYSVFVKNVPKDWTIESYDNKVIAEESKEIEEHVKVFFEAQIKEHVKNQYAEEIEESGSLDKTMEEIGIVDSTGAIIAEVTLCLDEGDDIKFYQSRKPLKKDINRTDWHIKKLKWELQQEKKAAPNDDGVGGMDEQKVKKLQKKIDKQKNHRAKVVKKMSKVMEKRKKANMKAKKHKRVVGAFVTFSTDMGHHMIIERYPKNYCAWCCQDKERRWHGTLASKSKYLNFDEKLMTRVRVKKAPEPTTLMWENFEVSWCSRLCRKTGTSIIALCLLVGSAMAVYYAKTVDATVAEKYCDTANPEQEIFPGVKCADYVKNTTMLDAETRCLPVLTLYPDAATFNRQVAANNVTGLGSTCFCRKYTVDPDVAVDIYESCAGYLLYSAQKLGAVLLSSFMILLINGIYNKVVQCMAHLERHHAIDSMQSSISFRAMLGQFCNTGLVYLLVNANLQGNAFFENYNAVQSSAGQILSNLSGYSDFTPKWYAEVGNAITLTLLMLAFSPHVFPIITYLRFHIRVNCRCCLTSAATQAELNQKFHPPQFHYMTRYAQISVSILICMMYSTGIPFLYVVAAITCFTFYWVDKAMFCWLYGKPPQYDPTINQSYSAVLGYALVIHVAFGTWMLGNKSILASSVGDNTEYVVQTMSDGTFSLRSDIAEAALTAINAYDIREHLLQAHVLPLFTLMVFLIFGTLLSFVWNLVGGIIRRVWNFITCGRCCDAKVVYLKAPLEDVRDNIALWGITSYNIFENPIYQMLFSTDEEYAKTHRHLEELGDIDALAVKEVEMSMKQPKSMSPGSSTKDGATKV